MTELKKLKITVSNEKRWEIGKIIRRIVRTGIGLIAISSLLLGWTLFPGTKQASQYEHIIRSHNWSEERKIQSGREFFDCIKETTDDNSSKTDFITEIEDLDSQFKEINRYLQNKKINVYNLDIYFFENKDQEKNWKVLKKKLFVVNLSKALIINNLTKITKTIQGLFSKELVKKQWFLFYSEVFIKTLFVILLMKFLEKDYRSEETLNELSIENFYAFGLALSGPSFITMLPPPNIQQMGLFSWILCYVCAVWFRIFSEEYVESNVMNPWEKKDFLTRKIRRFGIILETLFTELFIFLIGWSNYSKINVLIGKTMQRVLYLTNSLISNIIKIIACWKDNLLYRKINEKAL